MSLVKSSPSDELQELVENINAALNSIQKNGQHIMEWAHTIKTKELWRQTEAKSFSQFCEMQNWTVRRFDQLASGYAVLLTIQEETRTKVPTERVARELGKVTETKRDRAVKETEKRDGSVTTKGLAKTRKSDPSEYEPTEPAALSGPKEKEVVVDCEGTAVTAFALPFWGRRQEIQDLMTAISKIKCQIEKYKASEDPMFRCVSNGCIAELGQAYAHVSEAKPYAVCTDCEGWPETRVNGCGTCKSTGLISEFKWNTTSRQEIKDIRAKVVAMKNK